MHVLSMLLKPAPHHMCFKITAFRKKDTQAQYSSLFVVRRCLLERIAYINMSEGMGKAAVNPLAPASLSGSGGLPGMGTVRRYAVLARPPMRKSAGPKVVDTGR